MTITSLTTIAGVTGTGVETSIAFGFGYDMKTDLLVARSDLATGVVTELVLGQDYSIDDTTATLFEPAAVDTHTVVQRLSGLRTRNQFPSQYKFKPAGYGNAYDLDTMRIQEFFPINQIVTTDLDGDQDITTTEKLVMPSLSGVTINRTDTYHVILSVFWTPIPTDSTVTSSFITYRLRVGVDGDLTSELKQTSILPLFERQGPTPTDTYNYLVTFPLTAIAAGQKIGVSAEASVADDGDIRIFDGATTMRITT